MSIYATPAGTYEATLTNAPTGLVGTLGVRILDGQGGIITARTTAGIIESPAGSGIYTATGTAPAVRETYVLVWDTGGATPVFVAEDLIVTSLPPGNVTDASGLLPALDVILDRGNGGNPNDYDVDAKLAALTVAIAEFERAAGRVYFTREKTETVELSCADTILRLPIGAYDRVRDITSITGPDGTVDVNTVKVSGRRVRLDVELVQSIFWPAGDYTIAFVYGPDGPSDQVARAMVLIASAIVTDGPWDDRGYAIDTEGGFTRLLTAGVAGASFSIPEVQSVLATERVAEAGGF